MEHNLCHLAISSNDPVHRPGFALSKTTVIFIICVIGSRLFTGPFKACSKRAMQCRRCSPEACILHAVRRRQTFEPCCETAVRIWLALLHEQWTTTPSELETIELVAVLHPCMNGANQRPARNATKRVSCILKCKSQTCPKSLLAPARVRTAALRVQRSVHPFIGGDQQLSALTQLVETCTCQSACSTPPARWQSDAAQVTSAEVSGLWCSHRRHFQDQASSISQLR